MASVVIACNVPGGLILGLAAAPNGQFTVPVVLAGPPTGGGYSETEVDETFWNNWVTASQQPQQQPGGGVYYGNNPALLSGAVWEV